MTREYKEVLAPHWFPHIASMYQATLKIFRNFPDLSGCIDPVAGLVMAT